MRTSPDWTLTFSVAAAARLLGIERTTLYRLVWRDELKACAGFKRMRFSRTEIDRFLARTRSHDGVSVTRPHTSCSQGNRKVNQPVFPSSKGLNLEDVSSQHRTIFVPMQLLKNRSSDSRVVMTIVDDDEAIEPISFIQFTLDDLRGGLVA